MAAKAVGSSAAKAEEARAVVTRGPGLAAAARTATAAAGGAAAAATTDAAARAAAVRKAVAGAAMAVIWAVRVQGVGS